MSIFKVSLPQNVVQCRFAWSVRGTWHHDLVHASDTGPDAANTNKNALASVGRLQHRKRCLKKCQWAQDIDFVVLADIVKAGLGRGREALADAGVGDDEVEVRDALRLQPANCRGRGCRVFAVDM